MNKVLLASLLMIISLCSYARECNLYEYDKAEYILTNAAEELVQKSYSGGSNITIDLNDCNYNSYSNEYNLKVRVDWNGVLRKSKFYSVKGDISMKSDGSEFMFNETYANKQLRSWRFYSGAAVVTGLVIATVVADKMD